MSTPQGTTIQKEHTPAPTPHRAVYGFAIYMLFFTLFILYALWALLPATDELGLTYLPDKYFALLLPILILGGLTFFIFFIYPGINTSLTPDINELASAVDPKLICRMRSNDGTEKEITSWEQLKCPEKSEQEEVVEPKIIECELCSQSHHVKNSHPISILRFMDLEEVNHEMFGV